MLTDQEAIMAAISEAPSGICEMLKKALNDELLAEFQYRSCYWQSRGAGKVDCDPEFKEHADEEHDHAEKIARRIDELGGTITVNPARWEQDSNGFVQIDFDGCRRMLEVTHEAELTAIEFYRGLVRECEAAEDFTTKRLIKSILADEEKHEYDLRMLIGQF